MGLVTISDHNTIEGSLAIAHLPDTFVSVEITSYFPADGCKVHVLALDLCEAQFAEINRLRENVFELVPYLRSEGLVHVCAHPLYGVNGKMSLSHFEELLLLFKHLELNGAREGRANEVIRAVASSLTPEDMDRLAERHGFAADYPEPWVKYLTGGSDDHGSRNIARIHTEVPGAGSVEEFLEGIRSGNCRPLGQAATPETMAHNLYSIAYQFYKDKLALGRYVHKDLFLRLADRFLGAEEETKGGGVIDRLQTFWTTRRALRTRTTAGTRLTDLLRNEAARLICDDPDLSGIAKSGKALPDNQGQAWYRFVTRSANRVLTYFGDHLLGQLAGGNVFDIFQTVGSAGALYTVLAPYFVAYGLFNEDRRLADQVRSSLAPGSRRPESGRIKVGHFTDTFLEINGVALTIRRSLSLARATGKDMTVVTAYPEGRVAEPGVKNFAPIGAFSLPEYPELAVHYPPILDMLRHAYHENFSHLHSATPGPVGLAALLVARILKLPIHATYHTQIPQYARQLTGDEAMEELAWKYTIWYYQQMDLIYAPSKATAEELIERGISPEKISLFPRGVDTELFHPAKRNGAVAKLELPPDFTFLYVGRISREKNLHLLARAYRELLAGGLSANLVLAGEGPYLAELKRELTGCPRAVFAGLIEGEALAQLYASCDAFVFPSTTDTFGNVVLEAQASGLPVVVSDAGGPCENITPDQTGYIVPADDAAALVAAMRRLAGEPGLARRMGASARTAMEARSFAKAFSDSWELYGLAC